MSDAWQAEEEVMRRIAAESESIKGYKLYTFTRHDDPWQYAVIASNQEMATIAVATRFNIPVRDLKSRYLTTVVVWGVGEVARL